MRMKKFVRGEEKEKARSQWAAIICSAREWNGQGLSSLVQHALLSGRDPFHLRVFLLANKVLRRPRWRTERTRICSCDRHWERHRVSS